MTTATLSPTEITRLNIQLDTSPGLPKLPHIPRNILADPLTPEQQEANLLHVALWIVERDQKNLDMKVWHRAWVNDYSAEYSNWSTRASNREGFHSCGTAHCLAGFAQVMAGEEAFTTYPLDAGLRLLGREAVRHFHNNEYTALQYLKEVIARNS
jgi:hypothetical protein